jgi:hypothetical protein
MKYLKKFLLTEKIDINELQNFCSDNLAYLIDEGFEFKIKDGNGYTYITISKNHFEQLSNYYTFEWNEIKEDIIPFIIYLYDKYNFDHNMNIYDRHGVSEFIKISQSKLGFYKKSEININYLENLDIDYPITKIIFSKQK